jgi:antitoxin PrlF
VEKQFGVASILASVAATRPRYYNITLGNTSGGQMSTTLTSKGQVTIPKRIRDALRLASGSRVEFSVNRDGEVVLQNAEPATHTSRSKDRFEAARGKADVKWRTDELMALLRGAD